MASDDKILPDVVWNASILEWACCGADTSQVPFQPTCQTPTLEIVNAPGPSQLANFSLSTSSSTAVAQSTTGPTQAVPAMGSAAGSSLSPVQITGIAVGAAVGGTLLLLSIVLLTKRRLRRRNGRQPMTGKGVFEAPDSTKLYSDDKKSHSPVELTHVWNAAVGGGGGALRAELPHGQGAAQELPATRLDYR